MNIYKNSSTGNSSCGRTEFINGKRGNKKKSVSPFQVIFSSAKHRRF